MSAELKGLPAGWRAVRWGKVKRGESVVLTHSNEVFAPVDVEDWKHMNCLIVERIDPVEPEPTVRAFKNMDEFLEACDGHFWLLNIQTGGSEFVAYVDDNGIETLRGATSWQDLIECYEFPDGRVCGHED